MANQLYDKARERFLTGSLDWLTADIRAYLIDVGSNPTTEYLFNSTHEYLSSVPVGARRVGPLALTSKTATNGAASAANLTFTGVAVGPAIEAILLYVHTGVDSTAVLVAYIDVATGLPITPNGGDIILAWDTGVNRIFRL